MTTQPKAQHYSVLAFGAVLLALLWAAVLDQDHRVEALREAGYRQEMRNYVRLLEAHTRSVIRGLDQVVTHLEAEYESRPATFDLRAQVALSPILKGLSVQVGIIGADGYLLMSTSPQPPGERIDLSDREHYRVHVDKDPGELWIGKPVLGRASGQWSVQLARRLNTRDGAFKGVIVVSLSPDYIADIYRSIELGPDSAIVVVGRDGVVRARAMGDDRTVGQSIADAPYFARLWQAADGFVSGVSPIDGRERLIAFRRMSDYPLVVMVTRPMDSLRALFAHQHRLFLTAGWGGTLLIIVGTLLLQRQTLRQAATEQSLRAREAELEVTHADLERKNQDLEQFTEVLAHHLQEPVRLQYGFAQRLRRLLGDDMDADVRMAADYILTGALRQRALLHDVELYLSLDRLPTTAGPCDAAAAVREALARLDGKAEDARVTLALDGLPKVALDHARGVGVFSALIGNAFLYRRAEVPLEVRISGRRDGDVVTVTVADNGQGIAPEYRDRVFKVFERLHSNRAIPGTGIGLALARKVVEFAHGRIWLGDGIDGGVTVHVSLPVHKD